MRYLKFKIGHAPLGGDVIILVKLDIVYLFLKFQGTSISRSWDIIGGPKM